MTYIERVKQMSPKSVDQVVAAIAQFELSTNYRDFRRFHRNQAIAFQERLREAVNEKTGRHLAKATIYSRLMAMKAFIQWLQGQPGFRSRIAYGDAEYFNTSANDERIAKAHRERPVPSVEELRLAFDAMPSVTVVNRRDRALLGFAIVSGARDNALASFALKHVDLAARKIYQDARDVRTKNAKTFVSKFFPVDPVYAVTVGEWMAELQGLGYGPDDPLFPATAVQVGPEHHFVASGIKPQFWTTANAVRRIFKNAFERAGLPYYNPHSFRSTLAILGEKMCTTAEEWKAYSQNFGHSSPMTTFNSYGPVAPHRQAEILDALAEARSTSPMSSVTVQLDDDQMGLLIDGLAKKMVKAG